MTISTSQFNVIGVGTSENDGTGDPLRDAFIAVNDNFGNILTDGINVGNVNVNWSIEMQNTNDGVLSLPIYTVATAPTANASPDGSVIYVSDGDAGNATVAVSVANNWYVVALGAVISV